MREELSGEGMERRGISKTTHVSFFVMQMCRHFSSRRERGGEHCRDRGLLGWGRGEREKDGVKKNCITVLSWNKKCPFMQRQNCVCLCLQMKMISGVEVWKSN